MSKYYTSDEVAMHNCAEDCWVSIFDNVYDITKLILANRSVLSEPLIREAGKSISHWFDEKTKDVKTFIDPVQNIEMPYTPHGRFIHVPPSDPREWSTKYELPWWKDESYIVGKLTKKTRMVKVVNMLTQSEDVINTCQEETLSNIRERYLEYNSHAESYTWKALIADKMVVLDMDKTLEANGVMDETDLFYSLRMNDDFYIPTLHIYFNDDLTVA